MTPPHCPHLTAAHCSICRELATVKARVESLRDDLAEAFGLLRHHQLSHGTADTHVDDGDPVAQEWRKGRDAFIRRLNNRG